MGRCLGNYDAVGRLENFLADSVHLASLQIKLRGFLAHIQQLYISYWGMYSIKSPSLSPYGLPSPHAQDANIDIQQPTEASGRSWVQSMFSRDTSSRANSFSRVRKWTSDSGPLGVFLL